MAGDVNCLLTKVLVPFVEKEVGPDAVADLLRVAGRSRADLIADHNWLPLDVTNALIHRSMELVGERDEERFARRLWEYGMDWKPSREERSYLGTYSMGIGDPRALFQRQELFQRQVHRWGVFEVLEVGRTRARFRRTPLAGIRVPRWACVAMAVTFERFPMNWGLPRAVVVEPQCAARGDAACVWEVRWRNPSLGTRFWLPTAAGTAAAGALLLAAAAGAGWIASATAALPAVTGAALGIMLRERERRRHTQRLLDLQGEEVIYSNNELEKKFRDLETKIQQLSLLIDLSGAVNATLEPEQIYEQTLRRLVDGMGYQGANLFLVDADGQTIRGHKMAGGEPGAVAELRRLVFPLSIDSSLVAHVALSGRAMLIDDVESASPPVQIAAARAIRARALVLAPLRVRGRVWGVLEVLSSEPGRFAEADVELLSAVANHVALAIDKAESFQTIESLSRGLEDKVRVRTEQLRTAHEELQAAYRNLQSTQMQLVQREKMASVGQLVAGVAHELNNPIGFVFSNATTLEDFISRLRAMVETYRGLDLPDAARSLVEARWEELRIDYALKYLDSMTAGIREGAERARKIVRDLRVFARTQDDVWQAVDLHEELESSLTLLNHLLKDRIRVDRKFGEVPSVECVRSQIDQVFLNLLANAAQAIAGDGAITIETQQEDGHAVVRVTDTGPGIPSAVAPRIFDPFFTTKPVGEGTGLGLSISYEIVKKHGGELTAASPPGHGATFVVRIPITRGRDARELRSR